MLREVVCILVLLATVLGCIPVLGPGAAAQAPPDIQVLANDGTPDFPYEIEFTLELAGSSPAIQDVELEYGVDKVSCQATSVRAVPDVERDDAGGGLSATWTWDLRRSGSLPPGAQVWWRWHVTTGDGGAWTSPEGRLSFDDESHDWQTASQGQIFVHWYEGDAKFGQGMLRAAVEAQARLTADPGANLEQPVHIYFYATPGDLRDALVFSQRWTGGIAFTDYFTILIAAGPDDGTYGERTVAHELMHLVVHQLAFNCWAGLPRWLDEGLASWAEGDLESAQQSALDGAIANGRLLSLRSLSGSFSAHADRANLSYAQAYSVVDYMIEAYGRERILELLAAYRKGATYDGALEELYGFDTDGLEDRWRASVGAQPRPTASAPSGEPTAVPTLSLWSGEPTSPPGRSGEGDGGTPSATPVSTPSAAPVATSSPMPSETPAASPEPLATEIALESSPAPRLSPETIAIPETSHSHGWGWLILGGSLLFLAAVLIGVWVLSRSHP